MSDRISVPVALFAYNRLTHVRRVVESLLANAEAPATQLIVYSDGPKNDAERGKVDDVRHYLTTIKGFAGVEIVARPANVGLANNVISGVTESIGKSGRLIVMEDDLIASPYFLSYMNQALDLYEDEPDVISVHGYMYPVQEALPTSFFLDFRCSWGWGTWKRGWDIFRADGKALIHDLAERKLTDRFDLDGAYPFTKMLEDQVAGKNSSWAVRWSASACLAGKLSLYPGESLVFNGGNDSSGTHTGRTRLYDTKLRQTPVTLERLVVKEHLLARTALAHFHKEMPRTRLQRLAGVLKGRPW